MTRAVAKVKKAFWLGLQERIGDEVREIKRDRSCYLRTRDPAQFDIILKRILLEVKVRGSSINLMQD